MDLYAVTAPSVSRHHHPEGVMPGRTDDDRRTRCRCVELLEAVTAAGYDVTLDPAPLDPLGELRAAVAGVPTYTRHPAGDVHYRHPDTIRARPAGTRPRQDVHARHRCPPHPARKADP
jgi:hypothetical protein